MRNHQLLFIWLKRMRFVCWLSKCN